MNMAIDLEVAEIRGKLDADLDAALEGDDFERGFAAFTSKRSLAKAPHRIFWLRRREQQSDFESIEQFEQYQGIRDRKGILDIPTQYLNERICRKLQQNQSVQRRWIRDILTTSNLTRSAAGLIYECSFILAAKEGLELTIWPMHLCTKQWRIHISNPCPQCKKQPPVADCVKLHTDGIETTIPFESKRCLEVLPNYTKGEWTLWTPTNSNNQSVDCILVNVTSTKRKVYYIQCTLSNEHHGKPDPPLQRFSGPGWEEHYVFVTTHNNLRSNFDAGDGITPFLAMWGV